MKRRYKVLLVILVGLIAVGLLLQIDDELSPQAAAIIEKVDWQSPSNSYLYFLGMDAKLGSDPITVGKKVLSDIRKVEAEYSRIGRFEDLPSPNERIALDLGQYQGFCRPRDDENCLSLLFDGSDIPLDAPEMKTAKIRYMEMLNLGDFRTLTEPHFFEPFGSFTLLVNANRLISLEAIALAQAGQSELAIKSLSDLLDKQRLFLSQTDTLIARMIAYVLFNETIEVLALISRGFDVKAQPIEALLPRELSLEAAMHREFLFARSIALNMHNLYSDDSSWPTWALRIAFKPNITMNESLARYQRGIEIAGLETPIFEPMDSSWVDYSWVRNFFGSVLNYSATLDFDSYIARGFDLNVKIALFNGTLNKPISDEVLKSISNPYDESVHDAAMTEDGNSICMGGPLEDSHRYRCLTIRL